MKYIFGNWKMYLSHAEAVTLAQNLKEHMTSHEHEVVVFPNTISFAAVKTVVDETVMVGAQNVGWTPRGAYTGATSAAVFAEVGASHALVGHSERRHVFGESNEDIRKRLEACIDAGITPVLCIGETKEDRAAGKTEYRLKKQLMHAFEHLNLNGNDMVVAYEPVWAISKGGEGEPCMPEEAERMHIWIQEEIKQYTDQEIPIIYGGSVNAENVLTYTSESHVAGVLVGHASTKHDAFLAIIAAAATT